MQMKIVLLLLANVVLVNWEVNCSETIRGASYCTFTFGKDMKIILFLNKNMICERQIGTLGRKQLLESLISFSVAFKNQNEEQLLKLSKSVHNLHELEQFKIEMGLKIDRNAELPIDLKCSSNTDQSKYKFCPLY